MIIATSTAFAQITAGSNQNNQQTIFNANGTGTGVTVPLTVGGNIVIKNKSTLSVTIKVKNAAGVVIAHGVLAGDEYSGPHGLPAGTHTICYEVTGGGDEAQIPGGGTTPTAKVT